jgi:hypothetical protein
MILLSVFISCDGDDDDDDRHDPNWSYRQQQPQENSKFKVQSAKLWNLPEAEDFCSQAGCLSYANVSPDIYCRG